MKRVSVIRRGVLSRHVLVAAYARAGAGSCAVARCHSCGRRRPLCLESLPKREPGATQVLVGALDPRLRLARCERELTAALPTGATFRERMTIAVSCPEGNAWTIYVPVTIETRAKVLVLRQPVARGARIGATDVEVQERVVGGPSDSFLTDVAQLEGYTAKRPLAAGAALSIDALAVAMVVKRGQSVTLLASASGIEVRAPGRAMSDAPRLGTRQGSEPQHPPDRRGRRGERGRDSRLTPKVMARSADTGSRERGDSRCLTKSMV